MIPESSDCTVISVYPHIPKRFAEIFKPIESNSVSSSWCREKLFDPGSLHTLQ